MRTLMASDPVDLRTLSTAEEIAQFGYDPNAAGGQVLTEVESRALIPSWFVFLSGVAWGALLVVAAVAVF